MFSSSRLIHSLIVHVNRDYVVSTYSHEVLTTLWREFRKAYKSEKEFEKKLKRGIGKIKVDGQVKQNNNCGICLDTPDYNNLVTTSCGHHFCNSCYKKWVIEKTMIKDIENEDEELEGVTCPMCRENNPTLTYYKQKKKINKINITSKNKKLIKNHIPLKSIINLESVFKNDKQNKKAINKKNSKNNQ